MALLPTDKKGQQTVMIGLAGLIVCFLFYYFVYNKRVAKIVEQEEVVETLTNLTAGLVTTNGTYTRITQKIGAYEQHMKKLEELIPQRQDVPRLLYQIAEQAQIANVVWGGVKPNMTEPVAFYSRELYDVQVSGLYHDIGVYLAGLASLPRIIKATNMKLIIDPEATAKRPPGAPPIIKANFTIETYVIPAPGEIKPDTTKKGA